MFEIIKDFDIQLRFYEVKSSFFFRFQELFSRKDNPSKGVRGSTHLVCPSPDGEKYKASIKWNVPPVSRDWLVECALTGTRVEEDSFRVDAISRSQCSLDPLLVFKKIIRKILEYFFYEK